MTSFQVGWSRLVVFVSLLFVADSSAAQWTVSLYVGKSRTSPSDLEIVQPSLLNYVTFHNLSDSDESFKTPFYYGVRVGYFFQEPKFIGLEVEFVHLKVLTNPEEIVHMTDKCKGQPEDRIVRFGDVVESFSMTHGLNLQMANAAFRHHLLENFGSYARLSMVGLIGFGPIIPQSESQIGGVSQEQYEVTGRALHVGVGSEVRLLSIFYLLLEYKFTRSFFDNASVVNGTAKVSFRTHHFIFGMSVHR